MEQLFQKFQKKINSLPRSITKSLATFQLKKLVQKVKKPYSSTLAREICRTTSLMDDTFKIFVKRLKDGHEEKIHEQLAPDFLDIREAELSFQAPILVEGSACVANDVLVLTLAVETRATLPCAICNCAVQVEIFIPHFCYTESLSAIKGAVFDYSQVLREQILLELPYRTECNGGDCPERASLAKYFKKPE